MKRSIILACLLALAMTTGCKSPERAVTSALKEGILEQAAKWLDREPVTVTGFVAERSAGGIHDFYSEGDYWWPDPENPDGPYIRRDGESNPDNFSEHRKAMIDFSMAVGSLASAYLLTGRQEYADAVGKHVRAWFIDEQTRMNPSLLYAQAIKGRVTGRGIGIIDTIHLIEVAQALIRLEDVLGSDCVEGARQWFAQYLQWMTTHPYGIDEMNARNNHGTCWALQAAAFARFTGDREVTELCKQRFKEVFIPTQMAEDGSFPQELARTKPYGYSLFNLDAMATLCHILSEDGEDLWESLRKAVDYMLPYVQDKGGWPFAKDVMYWDEWPVAQPAFLFAWLRYGDDGYLQAWEKFEHFPTNAEVLRNLPVRNPLLWLED